MPEISRFLGIVITMYYNDHSPPHFHARYGEHEVTVLIDNGAAEGPFPRRALGLLLEWYAVHSVELSEDWELARLRKPLNKIEPLE